MKKTICLWMKIISVSFLLCSCIYLYTSNLLLNKKMDVLNAVILLKTQEVEATGVFYKNALKDQTDSLNNQCKLNLQKLVGQCEEAVYRAGEKCLKI